MSDLLKEPRELDPEEMGDPNDKSEPFIDSVDVMVPDGAKFYKHFKEREAAGASEEELRALVQEFKSGSTTYMQKEHNSQLRHEGSKPMPSQDEINQIYEEQLKEKPSMDEMLQKAQEALEAAKAKHKPSPILQIEDLTPKLQKHLSASARYDLSQKSNFLTAQENGRFYKAIYFATTVRGGDEELGGEYLARIINDLSSRGLIHSTLAPISSIKLAMTTSVFKSAIFCFVLIPEESHAEVQSLYPKFVADEGSLGNELYDLSPILGDGEFLTTIRIGYCPIFSPSQIRERFQEELNLYLAVLPKGTRVRKVTQLAVTDLSQGFEVKFHNPLLKEVKKVEIEYQRAVTPVGNRLEQFNVFKSISYIDKDGCFLYK